MNKTTRIALATEDLSIRFGGLKALDSVTFAARAGEIFSIIGPNGAGKTTLFNCISGLYQPTSGRVALEGRDTARLRPHQLAGLGLSRTFQNLQIFFQMSVIQNVMVGRHLNEESNFLFDFLGLPSVRRQNDLSRSIAMDYLKKVNLEDMADAPAGSLPYGGLKRLEIARALATEPKVLLLDEPAAGCNPVEATELEALIRSLANPSMTIILVEHNMKLVMTISDRILVLNSGRVLCEGIPEEVRTNAEVIGAYLGEQEGEGSQEAMHAAS